MVKAVAVKQSFSTPSPEVLSTIENENRIAALRQVGFAFEEKRRDLERKFEIAMSKLRDEYLSEVDAIHNGEEE